MKYQRFAPSGCKDIGIRYFAFVAKTQFLCKCTDIWLIEWNAIKLKLKTPEAPRPWLILSKVACAFIAFVIIEKVSELNTFKTRKRPPRPNHYSIRLRLSGYVVYWAFASLHGGSLDNTLTVIDSAGIWNLLIEKWCLRRKEYFLAILLTEKANKKKYFLPLNE